jgi:hypothetical protein
MLHNRVNPQKLICRIDVNDARWRATLAAMVVVAIQLSIALPTVIANECGPTPPPCEAYWQSSMVFLGTVTEALSIRNGKVERARMRVDRSYKGATEKTLTLFDDGMGDGPDEMRVGEQFLMYSFRNEDGEVSFRGCTRSRNVKDAEEDLKYLDGLGNATPTSSVLGQVEVWPDGQPASGAVVEIRGPDKKQTTTTDGKGHYRFDGLKPATYSVRAVQPGFRMPSFEHEGVSASIEPRGCAVINVELRKHWPGTIEGRLIRSNGALAPAGIDLHLILMGGQESEESTHLFYEDLVTNDKGEYSFQGVAPGRYKIAVHWCCFPTPAAPYPPIYWPAANSEAAASVIEIGNAIVSRRYDFHLPPEIRSRVTNGTVLLSDGNPAVGAHVRILKLPDYAVTGNDAVADMDGHFSFTALEGLEYSLTATSIGKPTLNSDSLHFSLDKGPQSITLVCLAP